MQNHTVLLIELGGTNARVQLWPKGEEILTCNITDYECLNDLIDGMVDPRALRGITRLYVAAPTLDDKGQIPNSENKFRVTLPEWNSLSANMVVLNDFVALALAMGNVAVLAPHTVDGDEFAPPQDKSTKYYVIGPGTGLGTASALWDPKTEKLGISPSESQHNHVVGYNENSLELIRKLAAILRPNDDSAAACPIISYEEVCSGDGLEIIYQALGTGLTVPASKIIETAARMNLLSRLAVGTWAEFLGVATANLMRAHYMPPDQATPVIVLGGGVIPKILGDFSRYADIKRSFQGDLFRTVFLPSFMKGLQTLAVGNPNVAPVFANKLEQTEIIIPTVPQPGMAGLQCMAWLQCYAAQNNRSYNTGCYDNPGP